MLREIHTVSPAIALAVNRQYKILDTTFSILWSSPRKKIDYAIVVGRKACLLIEAKWCIEQLDPHSSHHLTNGILVDNKTTRWICRLQIEGRKKSVIIRGGEAKKEERIPITNNNDLYGLKDKFVLAALSQQD